MKRSSLAGAVWLLTLVLLCGCATDQPTEHPYQITTKYSVGDPEFRRTVGNLLGPPFIGGNQTLTLVNGDRIFGPMLETINGAKKTINFETYVYWSGQVGAEFTGALARKAREGVKVHVIIDTMGADRIDPSYLKLMKESGVQVVMYHPLHWYDIGWTKKINNRTHRKLLIVDGEIGFTGGAGIADVWMGDGDSPKHWRDTHYMVRGPIVWQLQAGFVDNWMETTGHVLHGDEYFPDLPQVGSEWAQVFRSSPSGGSESMQLLYLLSIAAARKNIRISSAYFVPDELTIDALLKARQRGVMIQIIVPGKNIDEKIVRPASRAKWGPLLKAGIEIYEYQPTMYHCKLMIVDDQWVSIGSANFDERSFKLNDEANLNILDQIFADSQIDMFNNDLLKSKKVTYEDWKNRPAGERFFEAIASPFSWLL
jgi:cardiolipin synthase